MRLDANRARGVYFRGERDARVLGFATFAAELRVVGTVDYFFGGGERKDEGKREGRRGEGERSGLVVGIRGECDSGVSAPRRGSTTRRGETRDRL